MNKVLLTGRLTKDPEVRYTQSQKAVCRFNIAVQGWGKDEADFPTIVAFDRQAENLATYTERGSRVIVEGRLKTGSYEKDGQRVYTTEVYASNIEFIDFAQRQEQRPKEKEVEPTTPDVEFSLLDEEVPF